MSRKIKVYYAHFIDETIEANWKQLKGKFVFVRFKSKNDKLSLAGCSSGSKVRISTPLIS